jgi:phage/plasmid-associated DNA primase
MKTQCVRLIKAMLGADYFAEIEPELLTRARPSTACAAPDILMLAHKRCVCLSEICAREQLRTALMKRLTGDETLVARDLYSRRMVAVQPVATWLLLSNHDVDIAHTLDERHAIARRVRRLRSASESKHPLVDLDSYRSCCRCQTDLPLQ